jgi:YVTN family beta-propeller protein
MNRRVLIGQSWLTLFLLAVILPLGARAQTVTATLAVGTSPQYAAANPVTNKIYVANYGSSNVTVIDGASNGSTTVAAGTNPYSVAVNPVTNKIYVTNLASNTVTVIDGASNSATSVAVGAYPYSVAVNPVTNKIYVANHNSANVTVIDGATNTTTTVVAGSSPISIAVNPATNKVYVANATSSSVTVIDGASNTTTTVAAGSSPYSVAVNPVTNKIYVANRASNNATVIDGATDGTSTVAVGTTPTSVTVNPVSNKIYVANSGSANVTVIDGASNTTTTVAVGTGPSFVAINPAANQIYVAGSHNVTAIDGASESTTTLVAGGHPYSIAVNPVTNKIYGTNAASNNVTVIDGATFSTTTVSVGSVPVSVAVNPVTNKIYVGSNYSGNTVTVIDGVTNSTATVATGSTPSAIAVNPVTNKIYVANEGSNTVTVIDGVTNNTTTVVVGTRPISVAVNPVTNKIYVANVLTNNVTVIDGVTNGTTNVVVPSEPSLVTVNPVTNKIYVANENLTVIDGATNSTTTIATPTSGIAVNSVTNKIYITNGSTTLTVIDGVTNSTSTLMVGTYALSIAVNPLTNKIYIGYTFVDTLTVIHGATNSTTTVVTGSESITSIAVNTVTNKIYVGSGNVTVIDGATNSTTATTASGGQFTNVIAVNPVTNKIYVANQSGGSVSVIDEELVQPIPLTTSITPLPGNQTANPTPTFTFSAQSNTGAAPNGMFFQVDTWQNAWSEATGSNPSFAGTLAALQPGFHILYAYAVDGQQATSTQVGSPLTGAIQSYGFLVTGPPTAVSLSPSLSLGPTQTFTAVYSDPNGTADLASLRILFNTSKTAANACYVLYYPSSNLLYLENDGGTGLSTGITPGSSGHISNSQCTLAGTGSSYNVSGETAALVVALAFSATFTGQKNVYLQAWDIDGVSSAWTQEGYWTSSSLGPPTVVSLSPTSGSGLTQTFTAAYSDPNGIKDMYSVRILFNTTVNAAHGCYVLYHPVNNMLYLENDSGTGLSSIGLTPGSAGQLSNSQCTVAGIGSSYSASANNATLVVALTFSGTFTGQKNVYLQSWGIDNTFSAWTSKGTWTPSSLGPPEVISVYPTSGSGLTQPFLPSYYDPNGAADLAMVSILFNTSVNAAHACYVLYYPLTNLLYLENDAGTGLSTGITPGSTMQVSNSQCTLAGTGPLGSSYSAGGNDATLTLALTFSGTFTGQKNVYLQSWDAGGLSSGWVQEGTWTP